MGVCISTLMVGLEISSVPIILTTLENAFKADFEELQWVMNAYTLGCASMLMLTGALTDKYGRKQVFVLNVLIFGLSSLVCGASHNILTLNIARFIQGVSGGGMLICQISLISSHFNEGQIRSKAFALWGIAFGTGLGFGPLIGGLITSYMGWQWIFWIHVLMAIASILLIHYNVQKDKPFSQQKLDVWGTLTLTIAISLLTFSITQGYDLRPDELFSSIIPFLAISLFCVFVFIEKRSDHPLIDFSIFLRNNFSGAIVGAIGMNISFWPFMIFLPIYFLNVLNYDVNTTGLFLLAYSLPTLIFPPLGEQLSLRYHPSNVIPSGLFMISIGFFLVWLGTSLFPLDWPALLPGLIIAGTGIGITNTSVSNTSTAALEKSKAGMASGVDMTVRMVTLALNIAIMGNLFVKGILIHIEPLLSNTEDHAALQLLAANIAAGKSDECSISHLLSDDNVQNALIAGFETVEIYGAISSFVTALICLIVFKKRNWMCKIFQKSSK